LRFIEENELKAQHNRNNFSHKVSKMVPDISMMNRRSSRHYRFLSSWKRKWEAKEIELNPQWHFSVGGTSIITQLLLGVMQDQEIIPIGA
jgi:hypothetical protein